MNILERIKNIFPTHTPIAYSKQELENSTRIQKSTTPKYTTDWYIKWVASLFILSAMSVRGLVDYIYYDMIFSSRAAGAGKATGNSGLPNGHGVRKSGLLSKPYVYAHTFSLPSFKPPSLLFVTFSLEIINVTNLSVGN